MEIYFGIVISLILLGMCVLKNIYMGYALIISWLLFVLITLRKGYKFKDIMLMSYNGGKKSFVVIKILLLIGAVISIWMASGTIPTIVCYCLKYINPSYFTLSAFLICSITSFLIGTSGGTVSIVGIPLIILARSGSINLNIAAGAIIAGAFFGDRCSMMSSSAALVSGITDTNLFVNIKNMIKTSIIPLLLSLLFYYAISVHEPLRVLNTSLPTEISGTFNIGLIMLIPAFIILILSLLKVKVNNSIFISIIAAGFLALHFQNCSLKKIIYFAVFGFKLDHLNPLYKIIRGGGIISMLKTSFIVFISCSLVGIFEEINVFDDVKRKIADRKLNRKQLFNLTALIGLFMDGLSCSQTTGVIMTNEIIKDSYCKNNYELAMDIENTAIVFAAVIPWNIAALICTSAMNVNMIKYIPYAFYLYMIPVVTFILKKLDRIKAYTN
jgi:NhaC family Na+:H+ antiporter